MQTPLYPRTERYGPVGGGHTPRVHLHDHSQHSEANRGLESIYIFC